MFGRTRLVAAALSCVTAVVLCGSCGHGGSRPAAPPAAGTVAAPEGEAARLFDLVNRHREEIGARPLAWDPTLAAVAQHHSEDMVRRHYFSHTDKDGKGPFDRIHDAGVDYRAAAENIAEGQHDAREALHDWLHSPGHRKNLENPRYTHEGLGVYKHHWTQVLVEYR